MHAFCTTEEVNKQSEFRNDISTECISRHILYVQYRKSLHEKKVMVSAIALKLLGVPQTAEPISAVTEPKFDIL